MAWGNEGTVLISSWKCNYSIYLDIKVYYKDIQAISALLCFLFVLYSFYSFIFLYYNCSPEKWFFPVLKSLLLPQFSSYRYRTGFIVKRKQVRIANCLGLPINFIIFNFFILKLLDLRDTKYAIFKKFPKIY